LTNPFLGLPAAQIGIVVTDLEEAARRYSALWHNGPWRCWTYGPELLSEQRYRGEPSRFSVRVAINSTEPQIELLEPVAGPSVYHEWLDRHGPSPHHVAVLVDSVDGAIDFMAQNGYECLQLGRGFGLDGDGAFAYFDTERDLGLLLEAINRPARRHEPELVIP
jgi:methylmalonyl-CoA/ethylmalonyl-CoA epimerase